MRAAGVLRADPVTSANGHPQLAWIEAEHEMVHDRVPDHGDFEDVIPSDACLGHEISDEPVDGLSDHRSQPGFPAFVHHHI